MSGRPRGGEVLRDVLKEYRGTSSCRNLLAIEDFRLFTSSEMRIILSRVTSCNLQSRGTLVQMLRVHIMRKRVEEGIPIKRSLSSKKDDDHLKEATRRC